MPENASVPSAEAAKLQEAIDMIAQTFDHPPTMSIQYSAEDGTTRTEFEIHTPEDVSSYEVRYDGQRDEAEPDITHLE